MSVVPTEEAWRRVVRTVLAEEQRNQSTPRGGRRPRGYPPSGGSDIRLRCLINRAGGIDDTVSTFPVDNIEVITGNFEDQTIPDVHNDMLWEADDNALCYVEYVEDKSTDTVPYYHAYQVACPTT